MQPETISLLDDRNVMKKLLSVKKGCKLCYILTNKSDTIKAESKREDLHSTINWTKINSSPFKITPDTKLRWVQGRGKLVDRVDNVQGHRGSKGPPIKMYPHGCSLSMGPRGSCYASRWLQCRLLYGQ